jgi:hypothetical protein
MRESMAGLTHPKLTGSELETLSQQNNFTVFLSRISKDNDV